MTSVQGNETKGVKKIQKTTKGHAGRGYEEALRDVCGSDCNFFFLRFRQFIFMYIIVVAVILFFV